MINYKGAPVFYVDSAVKKTSVRRTWKERLFSLPWRPFVTMKVVYEPAIYQAGNSLLVHPALKAKFLAAVNNAKGGEE